MSQLKIYSKRIVASIKHTLGYTCILQESCQSQRCILLVRGDHFVGDCKRRIQLSGLYECHSYS